MLQVEFAALQVPTLRLCRAAGFGQPKMDQGFLKKILAQGGIAGHSPYDLNQGILYRGFVKVHCSVLSYCLFITRWARHDLTPIARNLTTALRASLSVVETSFFPETRQF